MYSDIISIASLFFAVGICGLGIGYCTKQNNAEEKLKDPILSCVERRLATVAECKELYRK